MSASLFKDDKAGISFGNALDNLAASSAGAIVGAVVSGGHGIGAWNGAVTASIIQQYNETAYHLVEKARAMGIEREDLFQKIEMLEKEMHMLENYHAAYDGEEPYYKDGHINLLVRRDEEDTLPNGSKMRQYNIDGVTDEHSFVLKMNRPGESSTAAVFLAKDPSNPFTPSFVIFRGTVSLGDWKTDVEQFLGTVPTGYKNAIGIGKSFSHSNIRDVEMGGSSMGGGNAIAAALAGNLPFVVSNTASLSKETEQFIYEHRPKKEYTQNIPSFGLINGNEMLHRIQSMPQTGAYNNFYSIHINEADDGFFRHSIENHSVARTLEEVKKYYFNKKHELENLIKQKEH